MSEYIDWEAVEIADFLDSSDEDSSSSSSSDDEGYYEDISPPSSPSFSDISIPSTVEIIEEEQPDSGIESDTDRDDQIDDDGECQIVYMSPSFQHLRYMYDSDSDADIFVLSFGPPPRM